MHRKLKRMITNKIEELLNEVKGLTANNAEEIEQLRIKYLSKKGEISQLMNDFRTVPAELKKTVGMKINELKQAAIDMNGHVNSVKYIENVLNLWETTFYTKNTIKRLEVDYMAESYFGDILCFYREDMGEGVYHIRITKQSTNDETEIDVCRIAVTFGSCK